MKFWMQRNIVCVSLCVFLNEMTHTHTHPATVVTLLVYASRDLCSSGNSAGSDEQQGAPGRISIKIQVSARRSGATSVLASRNKTREQALCGAHTLGRPSRRRKPSLRTRRRLRLKAKVGFEPAIRMVPLSSDHESLASVSDRDEDEVSSTRRARVCSAA